MILDEIERTLVSGSFNERIEILSYLCDVFESYNKNINNLNEIVQLLMNFALNSDNDEVSIEILYTISSAQVFQNITTVNFDPIAAMLDQASEKLIPRLIEILSYTHDKKYKAAILRYKSHRNPYIKEAVEDAMIELGISK